MATIHRFDYDDKCLYNMLYDIPCHQGFDATATHGF